jgi:hypothetical protein
MSIKTALIAATAVAIALTSFDLRPAAAAPQSTPAVAQQNAGITDLSAARRWRGRGVAPLAAFGAIAGTIVGIAAAQQRHDAYERYQGSYYGGGPYYEAPVRHYQPQPYNGAYGYGGAYGHPGWHGGADPQRSVVGDGVPLGANPAPGN